MNAPHLEVIDTKDIGVCGAETASGGACRHPAGENGRCWLPSHQDAPVAADRDLPDPPGHLNEHGERYWNYHVRRCDRVGVLERADLTVIEKAAEMAQILRRCWEHYEEHGPTVKDKNQGQKTNPSLAKYNSLIGDYRQVTKHIDGWVAQGDTDSTDDDESNPLADW